MKKWHNKSNKPLSSIEWLKIHHKAKFNERKKFLNKILPQNVSSIMDLGCGPGLWLDLINELVDDNCELIGVDIDDSYIKILEEKFKTWKRNGYSIKCNLDNEVDKLPKVDVILLFNILCFFKNPIELLNKLKSKLNKNGKIIIRQYDGELLRFGPMEETLRQEMNLSVYSSLTGSKQFDHYNMDKTFSVINNSDYNSKIIEFETIQKCSPYSNNFDKYLRETIEWNIEYSSEYVKNKLIKWYIEKYPFKSYFVEVDLIGILS